MTRKKDRLFCVFIHENGFWMKWRDKRMKKLKLMALVCACLLTLGACASQSQAPNRFAPVDTGTASGAQNLYGTNTGTANAGLTDDSDGYTDFDNGTYDPTSEEGNNVGDDGVVDIPDPVMEEENTATPVPTIRSEYAGATPVVIDPIDKPTPTPLPALSFEYQTYDATKLHLSFEGPTGWEVNDVSTDTYIITDIVTPTDYQASMTLRATSVTSNYTNNDLVKEVKGMLDTIGGTGFKSYSPSRTANRTLLDKAGVYANYTGTLTDGTKVAGRVHATCINKVLYTVHITYPKGYTNTYVDQVYGKMRSTITITK